MTWRTSRLGFARDIRANRSCWRGFRLPAVWRVASSPQGRLFDGYVLLAPYLGPFSPTNRPGGGGWAQVSMPRILALTALQPGYPDLEGTDGCALRRQSSGSVPDYSELFLSVSEKPSGAARPDLRIQTGQ